MTTAQTPLDTSLAAAARALVDFTSGPVASATDSIERAVTKSFSAVEQTIARAATSGKLSIDQLVNSILADFDRVAASQFIVKPLEGIVGSIASSLLPIGGARASGGPVAAGTPYLVGEEGPELFVPPSSGAIAPNGALGPAQITFNVQANDAQSFLKSESQIAAMLSRALAKGQRNL
jgi:phage-related minor tail protein